MAATLTSAMKADLGKGNGRVLIIPYTDTLTDTSFDNADELYTTNGTLTVAEGEPTQTEIKLDQNGGETLTNLYETTKTTIKGTVPFISTALYDYFYIQLATEEKPISGSTIKIKGQTFQVAGCYTLEKKITHVSVYLESQSGETAVIYHHCEIFAAIDDKTVNTSLASFNFTATPVLGGKFSVLKGGVPTT